MNDTSSPALAGPACGTDMKQAGRGKGVSRCPSCNAIFMDVKAMRGGAGRRPPVWMPIVMSVAFGLLATAIARRLRKR